MRARKEKRDEYQKSNQGGKLWKEVGKICRNIADLHKKGLYKKILYVMIYDRIVIANSLDKI